MIPRLVRFGNGLMSRTETGNLRWYSASVVGGAVLLLALLLILN